MTKLIIPAVAVGLGALLYIAKRRHHDEVPEEKTMYAPESAGGTLMEAGIE
jgi:hypothetical protein